MTDQILEHITSLILKSESAGALKELCLSFHVISACAAGMPEEDSPVEITPAAAASAPKRRGRPSKTPEPEPEPAAAEPAKTPEPEAEEVVLDLVAEDAPPAARGKEDLRNLINGHLASLDGKAKKDTAIKAWMVFFADNGAKATSDLADDKVETVISLIEGWIAKNPA